jgi:hypothetical protein
LRRHVAVARPDNVLDVQAVVLILIALPHSDLKKTEFLFLYVLFL